jgi:hypothetical protein
MSDTDRWVVGVLAIVSGGVLLLLGSLLETSVDYYVGIELAAAGAVLLPLGFGGISRVSSRIARIAAQSSGVAAGVALFGVGVGLTNMTYLTLSVVVTLAGLAILATVLSAAMSPSSSISNGVGLTATAGDPIPPGSGFCPYCGEPVAAGHAFCRKCGRPVSK